MLDSDTNAKLASLQGQLEAKQATLSALILYVQNVKATVAGAGMDLDEMLAMKETVFSDLPETEELERDLQKVTIALSAISKVLGS